MKLYSLLTVLIFVCGCTKNAATSDSQPMTEVQLATRGQAIYKLNCIACHNPDPSLDGATGPAIKGSSLELVTARVTKAQYPEGYKPKRDSKIMPPLPQLEKEVPALHAFLNSKN